MRLLIDAANVSSPGGVQLQHELARSVGARVPAGSDAVLLTAAAEELREVAGIRLVPVERLTGWTGIWRWLRSGLPRTAAELGADVVYSPGGILSRRVWRRHATINGVNSMLPFTPEHIRHFPLWHRDRHRLIILQRLYARGSRMADAVVVPSRFAIEAIRPYAGDIREKTVVAPNPVPAYVAYDPHRPPPHPNAGRPYFFYLSVVFWYKNHLGLIEGYRRALGEENSLPELLLAGPPSDAAYVELVRASIADPSLRGRVRYLGKVPRETIPGWLHHARGNLFASTCETNSFVQAEILGAHGVMACSNVGPMPEVAGGAAELFDPLDPDSIARAILRLWRDESRRSELRSLAARRAAEFTPEACGDAIWEAAGRAIATFRSR